MDDQTLVEKTDQLVNSEREVLASLLRHLREIDRRRLYSALGYKSLYDMVIRRYGYSGDEAFRRISAMRLLKDLPEMEERLNSGEISLTHMSLAQSFFQKEDFETREKLELLDQIATKPVREAQRIILSMSAQPELKPDQVKVVTEDFVELKFAVPKEVLEKIENLKALLAHQDPRVSLGSLFEKLCDLGLKEFAPKSSAAPKKRRIVKSLAQIKRDVMARARHQCENCRSRYALQIDHILPRAKGGLDEEENLRVLCRSCNQRAAIEDFGLKKMGMYLRN